MTTRTRYVVLGGAGVLVAGLTGGLVAWLSGNLPGLVLAQERPDELRYLPAEATLISFANVREVMDSELRRRLREIQPDLGGRREFRERTGIDIEEDIDYFVAGLVPEGPNDVGGIAVLAGRFDAARLETLAVSVGGSASEHGGRRLVTVGGDALAMGFLEPGVVALGSEALVRRAVDLPSTGGGVDSDERLMGLLRHVGDGSTAWTVGRLDDGAAGDWLPDQVEQQVSQVTGFAIGGRVNGGVSGTLTAEAADEETGRNLRDLLQGFLALARLQADSRPELGGLLDAIRLSAAGATVTLSFELPADVVLELLPDRRKRTGTATPGRTADRLVVPAHIFFYGTLMRGFALRERSGVDHLIRFVGPGEIRGALFDLGPYPGAVEGEGTVRGEVYDILAPDSLLARVDALEHYMPGAPAESQYRRCAVRARLDDGQARDVWVYFYNRPLGRARALVDGDYRRHFAAR